jgi:hypothetical protein
MSAKVPQALVATAYNEEPHHIPHRVLSYAHMLLTPSLLENLYRLFCSMVAHSVLLFRVCSRFNKEISKLVDGQLRKRRGIRYNIQDPEARKSGNDSRLKFKHTFSGALHRNDAKCACGKD